MVGHFLCAFVLILVLGFEQGSSSVLNDPDRLEEDTYTTADVADDLAELNDLEVEKVQDSVSADVCKEIKDEFKAVQKKSMAEAKKENPDSMIFWRQVAVRRSLRRSFQILQHGKRSKVDNSIAVRALRNEACAKHAIQDICETTKVLDLLNIPLNTRK